MHVNAVFTLHNPASSGRGPWGLGGIRATWQVGDEGSHYTTLHQQARQTALLFYPQNNLLHQKLKWKVTFAHSWRFSLQTKTRSRKVVCVLLCRENTKRRCCCSSSAAHFHINGDRHVCSHPHQTGYLTWDIHSELEFQAVFGRLTGVFEVLTLNDPGSPSGQLPYPELGEESSRQPADWAKIVWRERDLRLTGRTTLTHRWLTGLWVKGVSEGRRYWAKSVFV